MNTQRLFLAFWPNESQLEKLHEIQCDYVGWGKEVLPENFHVTLLFLGDIPYQVADCFTAVPLELNVNLPPAINEFGIYEICENETNSFDLSDINDVIVAVNFNVLFSYFTSLEDANANENALDTNYTYTTHRVSAGVR